MFKYQFCVKKVYKTISWSKILRKKKKFTQPKRLYIFKNSILLCEAFKLDRIIAEV